MAILLAAIILIYASLRTTPPQKNAPTKPKSTSQDSAAKSKSGSQNSPDKPDAKQPTSPSSPRPSSPSNGGEASQNLADAGPGDAAVALFLITVLFGYVSHRSYLKRTL
ncbi:MAG TPA: hypothetical protein VD706_01525 [Candidatus Saccharimonadales bacterium]|nr:hypothetical protein [Candidatus Saccharimonadales bacterium]